MSTRGEDIVRLGFNPSGHSAVNHVKRQCADLIDFLDQRIPAAERSERARSKNLAVTAIEEASMHAVKALTADVVAT